MIAAGVAVDPFVARFDAAWSSRDPEVLGALLHPDVVLEQPMSPVLRGRAAAVASLGGVLDMMPDLQITVHDWMKRGDEFFVVFSFSGTVGVRGLQWTIVDRIVLEDGLIRSRVAYFDPGPLVRALLSQPWLWPKALFRSLSRRRSNA